MKISTLLTGVFILVPSCLSASSNWNWATINYLEDFSPSPINEFLTINKTNLEDKSSCTIENRDSEEKLIEKNVIEFNENQTHSSITTTDSLGTINHTRFIWENQQLTEKLIEEASKENPTNYSVLQKNRYVYSDEGKIAKNIELRPNEDNLFIEKSKIEFEYDAEQGVTIEIESDRDESGTWIKRYKTIYRRIDDNTVEAQFHKMVSSKWELKGTGSLTFSEGNLIKAGRTESGSEMSLDVTLSSGNVEGYLSSDGAESIKSIVSYDNNFLSEITDYTVAYSDGYETTEELYTKTFRFSSSTTALENRDNTASITAVVKKSSKGYTFTLPTSITNDTQMQVFSLSGRLITSVTPSISGESAIFTLEKKNIAKGQYVIRLSNGLYSTKIKM